MKVLIKRILYLLPLYFAIRVVFYFYNQNLYIANTASQVLSALVYGVRFDIAAIVLLNLIFILSSLIFVNFERFNKSLFVILNLVGLSFLVVDIEFFQFLGKKMTFDIFGIGGDIASQSSQLIFYYWKLLVMYIVCSFYIIKFYPSKVKLKKSLKEIISLKNIVYSFLIIGVCFVAIRGGLQSRSIGPKEAFVFEDHSLGNLALNPVYTMIRSSLKKSEKTVSYFPKDEDSVNILKENLKFKVQEFNHQKKQNVVILILESFSYEYIKDGFAPFVSSLKNKSLYFEGYANGRRSIEALPSILVGVPSIASTPISQSAFQGNKFYSFANYLKGYEYSFYHGGKNGTMGFDSFTKAIGIENYFGLSEYPNKKHFDGSWGIFDHHYLEYFKNQLSAKKEPFISTLFTLSSHQPYSIPNEFKGRFDKGTLEIHETIGYSDNALKLFFESAQKTKWFNDTLFVITADHTQKLKSKEYNSDFGRYRVPVIFYHPRIDLNKFQSDRAVSHTDILPSILDFLDANHQPKILLGNSVFSNDNGHLFNKTTSSYLVLKKDEKLKDAFVQYFMNGLIKNNLYK